jgi:hypothetical protein
MTAVAMDDTLEARDGGFPFCSIARADALSMFGNEWRLAVASPDLRPRALSTMHFRAPTRSSDILPEDLHTDSPPDEIAEMLQGQPSMVKATEVAKLIRKSRRTVGRYYVAGRLEGFRAIEGGFSPLLIFLWSLEAFLGNAAGR